MKYIEDWSLRYAILRHFVNGVFRLMFRKIQIEGIEGIERIPKDKPVILAPNHQNALTDALTIIYSYPPQPIFLARADIFKKRLIIALLTFLKIMPVFRIRDGFDSLSKNDKTFDACIRLLKKNKTLSLFPEATHNGQKSMLPHKKAIPRIAFLVGEKTNFEIDLYIVPVGINYSNYYKFRSDLVIRYGTPISIKEYYQIYKNENEVAATNTLRDRIFSELAKVCVNVPDKSLYEVYTGLFDLLEYDICIKQGMKITPANLFKTENFLIEKLSPLFANESLQKDKIIKAVIQNTQLKEELKIDETIIRNGRVSFPEIILNVLLQLSLSVFTLTGTILFGWIYYLAFCVVKSKVKDRHFYSTFSYVALLVLLPIWLIVLAVLSFVLIKSWMISLLFIAVSVPCAIIAFETWQAIIRLINRKRFGKLSKSGNQSLRIILENREFLVSTINKIIN